MIPLVFGEGQWQGFRPHVCALCVNTAHETWPQLIQLMTQRGRGQHRTLQKNMADVLKPGGMRETATIKAETPVNQAKVSGDAQFESYCCAKQPLKRNKEDCSYLFYLQWI